MKINLSRNEIFFIDGDTRDISIGCETGSLWITQSNDYRDHILQIGKTHNVTQKGKVIVMAMTDSIVKFSKLKLNSNKKMLNLFRSNPMIKLC